MRRCLFALLLAVVALLATTTANAATTPSCAGNNYYMQCAKNAPQPPATTKPGGSPQVFGIDTYGAGNSGYPGANFDCSYLSGSPGGKDWTRGGIAAWTSRGRKACFVWETYATRAEYGYGAGQQDAVRARNEMTELGMPTYVPVDFAVDTDTSANDVAAYFQGVKSVLGIRTGAYGSYYVVAGLESRGITTPRADWQTVAWSGGNRGRACKYQSSIEHNSAYGNVDYDYASCQDYGQYPFRQTPSIICFGKKAQGNATCRKVHANVRKWQSASAASKRVFGKRGCPTLTQVRDKLNQRWSWFWNQLRYHPKVKHAHREQALKATGKALNNIRRTISGRSCLTFSGRVAYFNGRIAAVKKQYGS